MTADKSLAPGTRDRNPGDGPDVQPEGGDPACWAGLVCSECGAVVSEGHQPGCSLAGDGPK